MDTGEIILYQTADGETAIDVTLGHDTIWLTQKQIAELFGTKRPAITKHLKIYSYQASWMKLQLVPFWNILPPTGKIRYVVL